MTYPGAITTYTAKTDNVDDVMAADINELQADITAIETAVGVNPQGDATDLVERLSYVISPGGLLMLGTATELTISSGAVTVTGNHHTIDTEGDAASDDLNTINGGSGDLDGLVIFIHAASDARTVVIKHDDGNIWCKTGADITLNEWYSSAWGIWDDTLGMWFIQ